MNNKVLSIAVPTYNMEAYLGRCLDSMVNVNEVVDRLEIIVVNDGSKDRSLGIANTYKKRFPESVIVIDKPNGNYGSCVNAALKVATGKYFRIVDADDWVDSEGLESLINKLKNVDVDIVVTGYKKVFLNGIKDEKHISNFPFKNEVLEFESQKLNKADIKDFVMHSLTIRLAHLKDIGYVQTEGISYTDTEYVYYPMISANTIIFLDIILYNYFIGRSGQTVALSSQAKNSYDRFLIVSRMINETTEIPKDCFRKRLQTELLKWVCSSYFWSVLVIQKLTHDNRNALLSLDEEIALRFPVLTGILDKERCLGVKYIRIWHKWHIQPINHHLYIFLRKLFK